MTYYKLVFLFCVLVLALNLEAQEGMIKYRQVWRLSPSSEQRDTKGVPAYLYFKNDKSLYVYNRSKDISPEKYTSAKVHNNLVRLNLDYADRLGNMFYKDFASGKLKMRKLAVGDAFISEEPLPIIKWKIVQDKKDIGIFHCRKAIAHFRGRDYEAWFTPQIPLKNGPWKFHGLPGLIMEVYDKNKEIYFQADAVNIPFNTEHELVIPSQGTPLSFEEFRSIEVRQTQKLIQSLKSSYGITGNNQIRFNYYPLEKDYE